MVHNKIEIRNQQDKIITNGTIISFSEKEYTIIFENLNVLTEQQDVRVYIFDDIEGIQVYKAKIRYIIEDKATVVLGDKINIMQRRKNVKVKYVQEADIKAYLMNNKEISSLTLSKPILIKITDIGAGGIFFISSEYIGIGQKFNLDLVYQGHAITIMVQIIRTQKVENFKIGYGCKFINLTKQQESFLTSTVFKLQLKSKQVTK